MGIGQHPGPAAIEASSSQLAGLPAPINLIELIEAPAMKHPEGVAVHLCHHRSEPEAITWGALWHSARAEAMRLRQAGVKRGDRVMLILPTSRAFIDAFFGVVLAGGIPVPTAPPTSVRGPELNPYQELLRIIAADSGAVACISEARLLLMLRASLHEANPQMRFLHAESQVGVDAAGEVAQLDASNTAFIQYTSGSTSRPKGVVLSHGNVLANIEAIGDVLLRPDDIGCSWLPLYHDMGLIGSLLSCLRARVPVIIMPPQAFIKNPVHWLQSISDYGATITVAPNFAFNYCATAIEIDTVADLRLDSLRVALNGAEPVDLAAVKRFEEKFQPLGLRPGVVRPVYGLAESTLAVTFSEPGPFVSDEVDADRLERTGDAVSAGPQDRKHVSISVGRPIPTQQVGIVEANGQALPERRVGEIVVKGPSVMQAYYNRPDETAEVLRDGWLHTGDLGYLADGRLYITGRSKDVIIRHGRNYYSQDIEAQVAHIEGIRKGCTVAFSVEEANSLSIVVVAETRQHDPQVQSQLIRMIREQVHHAFRFGPDDVRLVTPGTIPKTSSGKVRRQECKRMYLGGELDVMRRRNYGVLLKWVLRSWWIAVRRRGTT